MSKEATNPVPCVICGKVLKQIMGDPSVNQPNDAVAFNSPGNYGSKVHDSVSPRLVYMEIAICDSCLTDDVIAKRTRLVIYNNRYVTEIEEVTREAGANGRG